MGKLCDLCLCKNKLKKNHYEDELLEKDYNDLFVKNTGAYVASSDILIPQRDSIYYKKTFKMNNYHTKITYQIEFFKYKYICELCLYILIYYKQVTEIESNEVKEDNKINEIFCDYFI